MADEEQYFNFKRQSKGVLIIDGNFMLNISRLLNIKLDMEKLFEELTKGMFRFRTYWYSALESSLDRNNNAYRFLDRLRYIPRTRVYAGRMTKRPQGHFESALRTDAGIALAVKIIDIANLGDIDYIIFVAGDPEYVPAIRYAQRKGVLVRLVYPQYLGDLDPHPDLLKAVDERMGLDSVFFQEFEYTDYDNDDYEEDQDDDSYEEEFEEDFDEVDEDVFLDEEDEFLDDDIEILSSDADEFD